MISITVIAETLEKQNSSRKSFSLVAVVIWYCTSSPMTEWALLVIPKVLAPFLLAILTASNTLSDSPELLIAISTSPFPKVKE